MNITHSIGLDIHKSSARYHILDSAAHRVARGPLKAAKAAVQQQLKQMDRKIDQLLIPCAGTEMIRLARSIPGFGAKTTPPSWPSSRPNACNTAARGKTTNKPPSISCANSSLDSSLYWSIRRHSHPLHRNYETFT